MSVQLILEEHETKKRFGLFGERPTPEPGIAIVLYRKSGNLLTLDPGSRMTDGEAVYGNFTKWYRVDIATHSLEFTCNLPSNGDVLNFDVGVSIKYQVADPASIVRRKLTYAEESLKNALIEQMRLLTRRYDISQGAEAETHIKKNLRSPSLDAAFAVTMESIQLAAPEEYTEIVKRATLKQVDINYQRQTEKSQADLDAERLQRTMAVERDRARHYSGFISGQRYDLLSLQLARNPNELPAVVQALRDQQQRDRENVLAVIEIALKNDVIEGYHLEEAARKALQQLVTMLHSDMKGANLLSSKTDDQ